MARSATARSVAHYICTLAIVAATLMCAISPTALAARENTMDDNPPVSLSNDYCAIRLNRLTGGILGIENIALGDEVLKAGVGGPYRIHADFDADWLLETDPEDAARTHLSPRDMTVNVLRTSATKTEKRVRIAARGGGFACDLRIALLNGSGESVWKLTIMNVGDRPRDVIVDFPRLEGVHPGPSGAPLRDTRLDMAGRIVPAWSQPGGIYGDGGEWSMQWHSIYDPASQSALGLIVQDPDVLNKRLVLAEPNVLVRYFPPRRLAPGESMTLPPVRLLVGANGWQQTARAYRRWYTKTVHALEPPAWARQMDVLYSGHFSKRPAGAKPDTSGQFQLDSFRELPEAHLKTPYDSIEYAFWTRGSQLHGVHTDGDNFVREDLGGPQALRDGIATLHGLGLHTTLYIEGYIVPKQSDWLGKAKRSDGRS